jgi:hypothetical protein
VEASLGLGIGELIGLIRRALVSITGWGNKQFLGDAGRLGRISVSCLFVSPSPSNGERIR